MQKQATIADQFNDWLKKNEFNLPECPVSSGKRWAIAEQIVEFRPYEGGKLVLEGRVYPAVMLVCQDCGYTMFINAALINLV